MLDKTPVRHWLPQATKCRSVTSAILLFFSVSESSYSSEPKPQTALSPGIPLEAAPDSESALALEYPTTVFRALKISPSFTGGLFAHAQIRESSMFFLF